jgi:hypothetical protein
MIGWLAPDAPAPDPACAYCRDVAGRRRTAGSFYCFVCDGWETDYCRRCWLELHDHDRQTECHEECVRLQSPSGWYVSIPGDHASRYRPDAYVELLERWEWDEERAPRYLVARADEYAELLALVQDVVDRAERIVHDVIGPDEQIVDALLRVLRSPRRLKSWRARLGGVQMVLDVLLAAVGDAARRDAARAAWLPEPGTPALVCDTICTTCGAPTAPYGPAQAPHECVRCLMVRLQAERHA